MNRHPTSPPRPQRTIDVALDARLTGTHVTTLMLENCPTTQNYYDLSSCEHFIPFVPLTVSPRWNDLVMLDHHTYRVTSVFRLKSHDGVLFVRACWYACHRTPAEEIAQFIIDAQCIDCHTPDPALYMVHDRVWSSVVDSYRGLLCIACLETRLGHRLVPEDFTDASINEYATDPFIRERVGLPPL